MPSLLQRVRRDEGQNPIPGHDFVNVLVAYCHGHITQTECYQTLKMQGTGPDRLQQQADFELLKVKYDSFPTTNAGKIDQEKWLQDVISQEHLLSLGTVTRAQFNTNLGVALTI